MAANPTSFAILPQETSTVLDGTHEFSGLELTVRQHAHLIFKVAYGVLRNSHDAEDIVQDVFLRVHRGGTRGVRDLSGWLATIAFRLAIDRQRKPVALDIADFELAASAPDAEHVAMHRQQIDRVHRLIASLSEDLRYPLVLSAIEELNSRQIGEVLRIPESSVRGRILRARQILKEKLAITEAKR
ncbi:MAG: sigma-70 family RNA polymerase sigma factor [Candidatus Korobacteraceae bacterium]